MHVRTRVTTFLLTYVSDGLLRELVLAVRDGNRTLRTLEAGQTRLTALLEALAARDSERDRALDTRLAALERAVAALQERGS